MVWTSGKFGHLVCAAGVSSLVACDGTFAALHRSEADAGTKPAADVGHTESSERYVGLGIKGDRPGDLDWIRETGTPFDYRYGYLAGGVNTGAGWAEWESPRGDYLARFLKTSRDEGLTPVISYYQIVPSNPNPYREPPYENLRDAATMRAYFADLRLALELASGFGGEVIIHHEPDLWGYLQQHNTDPTQSPVAVASSGSPDGTGFENNARGLAQAIVQLRDRVAPNVTLAWHATQWVTEDLTGQNADGRVLGGAVADYYRALRADFDLIFFGPSDRDAAWRTLIRGHHGAWWDTSDFEHFRRFIDVMLSRTGLEGMVWQIPLGNTLYLSCDNTPGHYQDNRAEFFLLPENRQNVRDFAAAGIIGLLFGGGFTSQTNVRDTESDGITNPMPINGNDRVALHADDDGGFLRTAARDYYAAGPVPLP